jgi:TRAP-type C4-dicarboxylate transport system substrate-binding protein
LKGEETAALIEKVEQTLREVTKLKGSVKVVPSGALADAKKTIEDIRKWD